MGQADTPRLGVSIDRDKAFSMGVPMTEISNSLAVMFGSSYVGTSCTAARCAASSSRRTGRAA